MFLQQGFELLALLLAQVLLIFATVYQLVFQSVNRDPAWIVQLVVALLAAAVVVACTILMHRRFRLYEYSGSSDRAMQAIVLNRYVAVTLLKVDMMFSMAMILFAGT